MASRSAHRRAYYQKLKADPERYALYLQRMRERHASKMKNAAFRRKRRRQANAARSKATKATLAERDRKTRLKTHYALSLAGYEAMLAAQKGVCAICGSADPHGRVSPVRAKSFAVDHCHSTGKVRGLLCGNCNVGLGRFKDDPQRLLNAVAYLQKHSLA